MAAKRTADIVPLAHPGLGITGVEIDVEVIHPHPPSPSSSSDASNPDSYLEKNGLEMPHGGLAITSTVTCFGRTGVEMEALTAVMGAALTAYDMCKAVDKGMVIGGARVVRKKGGKSGDWEEGKRV